MKKEKENLIYKSDSKDETFKLGKKIGKIVDKDQLILLSGDLGAGKTLLVQGIARGLHIDERITSPTFNLIKEYKGDCNLFHMDLYRLDSSEELYNIGFIDYIDRTGIVVIEWPEVALKLLPREYLYITLEVMNTNTRKLIFNAEGERANKLLKGLSQYADSWN